MNKLILVALLGAALVGSAVLLTQHKVKSASNVEAQWKAWKQQYGLRFSSEQDAFRMEVFAENLATIENDTTGTLGQTQFMALTQEEFAETYLTLKSNNTVEAPNTPVNGNTIDWTAAGKVTAVKNQGACGSCWAFSTTGSVESIQIIKKNAPVTIDLSEQQLVDCAGGLVYRNQGCNGGLMDSAFKYIIANKITTESNYPYTAKDGKCNKSEVATGTTTISGFTDVAKNPTALLAALQQQPISVAVDASNWSLYKGGVFSNCGTKLNHGVLLTGFDGQNWIVKNSWGTTWGNAGYITLAGGNTCGIANDPSFPTV